MAPGLATWARAVNMQAGTSAGTFAGAICLFVSFLDPGSDSLLSENPRAERALPPVGYPRHLLGASRSQ